MGVLKNILERVARLMVAGYEKEVAINLALDDFDIECYDKKEYDRVLLELEKKNENKNWVCFQ